MDKLNTGNAIFNLVISGKDTYKVHITDFQSIDFSNAHQIKNILGIEDDQMGGINIVKQYPVKDTNNKVVVSDGDSAISNVVIPNGNYSFDDYLSMLESKLRLSTPLVSIDYQSSSIPFYSSLNVNNQNRMTQNNYQFHSLDKVIVLLSKLYVVLFTALLKH